MPVINKKSMEKTKLLNLCLSGAPLLGSVGLAYLSYDATFGPFADNGMPETLLGLSAFCGVVSLCAFLVTQKTK